MKWEYLLLVLPFLFLGCTYENEEDYYNTVCDTTNITFNNTIHFMLDANCLGCHFNNNSISNIDLEAYEDVMTHVNSGSFLGTIDHQAGYPPMPQNGQKLDECTINQVKAWINNGAPKE